MNSSVSSSERTDPADVSLHRTDSLASAVPDAATPFPGSLAARAKSAIDVLPIATAPPPRRAAQLARFGAALEKDLDRDGDVDVALNVLNARSLAGKQRKQSRIGRLVSRQPGGRTAVYDNADQPPAGSAAWTHHRKLKLGWLGIDDAERKVVKKGLVKSGVLEPVHSIVGRVALFGAQGGSQKLAGAAEKIALKETSTSAVSAPATAITRIVTEVAQKIVRDGGAPKLARNIETVPDMVEVHKGMIAAQRELGRSNAELRNVIDLAGFHSKKHGRASPALVEQARSRYAAHMRVRAGADAAAMKYRLRTAAARRQHIGKAWGGAVNLVSGGVATPMVLTPLAPVAIGLQGALIGAQGVAGYADEKAKHAYTSRINLKYADILKDGASHRLVDHIAAQDIDPGKLAAQGPDVQAAAAQGYYMLERAQLAAILKDCAQPKLAFQVTRDDIDTQKLHDLFEGKQEARLALTREIYIRERSLLAREQWQLADRQATASAASLPRLRQAQRDIAAAIARLERDIDRLEFGAFDSIDADGLVGQCLHSDWQLFRHGVAAAADKPGQFWAQALQRYVGNFHALAGPGVATVFHDVLLAAEGVEFTHPDSPQYAPASANVDIAAATLGGATSAAITGAVRDHKDAMDKKKLGGPRWLRSKKPTQGQASTTPAMLARLDARWIVTTPGGHTIDMSRTAACYEDLVPLPRRVARVFRAIPAGLFSGPVGTVNTLQARPRYGKLKAELGTADRLARQLCDMLDDAPPQAPASIPSLDLSDPGGSSNSRPADAAPQSHYASRPARVAHRGKYQPGHRIALPHGGGTINAFSLPGPGYHEVQCVELCGRHTMHMYDRGRWLTPPALFHAFLLEDNEQALAGLYPAHGAAYRTALARRLAEQGASLEQVARFRNHARSGAEAVKVHPGGGTLVDGALQGAAGARVAAHLGRADRVMLEYCRLERGQRIVESLALMRGADGRIRAMNSRTAPGALKDLGTDMCGALTGLVGAEAEADAQGGQVFRYLVDAGDAREGDRSLGLVADHVPDSDAPHYSAAARQHLSPDGGGATTPPRAGTLDLLRKRASLVEPNWGDALVADFNRRLTQDRLA